ncbi:hypothetical protein H4696_003353 [Amycolatopsis lexingtonensis]|uniref:Uncharacterized protein n=1 Tax=Amycolatopsis lexingtonensis TaxID=218822 RepID=A0ABR9HZB8_9PSEU|nr:hypothetical protein [Amycolatopsis lexingtonensis]
MTTSNGITQTNAPTVAAVSRSSMPFACMPFEPSSARTVHALHIGPNAGLGRSRDLPLAVSYQSHDEDILENQLLAAAVEKLAKVPTHSTRT